MSDVVVVVGPKVISGPGAVDPDASSVALDCIDDDLALVDDHVLSVDDLWAHVLGSVMNRSCDTALLICPSWWADSRVERVTAAARRWTAQPVVRRRVDVLATVPTMVELAAELVVVHSSGQRHAIARSGATRDVVDAIVSCLHGLDAVSIDVPSGLSRFGAELSRALRHGGVDVTVVDDYALAGAARTRYGGARNGGASKDDAAPWRRVLTPRAAVLAVAVLSATALAAAGGMRTEPATVEDAIWLVEGRIAVEVPAGWTVERITSGPGSARLQVFSPIDRSVAIHLTQSGVPVGQTLAAAAETLELALADEPDGVFVAFVAVGERARRPAVTYREIRADRRIDWTVLLDGGVRIAIGCEGTAQKQGPEQSCDRAIRSAHALGRK